MSTKHAISFDVEEYYQVANLRLNYPKQDWDEIPSRLSIGMEHILSALKKHNARATFFFLGWIAERHPDWVKRCLDAGHGWLATAMTTTSFGTWVPRAWSRTSKGQKRLWRLPVRRGPGGFEPRHSL